MTICFNKKIPSIIVGLTIFVIAFGYFYFQPKIPDFSDYQAGPERKKVFFNYFLPLIEEQNQEIMETRHQLEEWNNNRENIGWWDAMEIRNLAESYGVESFDTESDSDWNVLLRRIDTVPPSLALAQAATESNWGTSRFARVGYNFFGQWCFEEGCGIVPDQRDEGKTHEVAVFDSPEASVASYIHNLNSHAAYKPLREIRAMLRTTNNPIPGKMLAAGLGKYSERGEAYIEELRALITYNQLSQYDYP